MVGAAAAVLLAGRKRRTTVPIAHVLPAGTPGGGMVNVAAATAVIAYSAPSIDTRSATASPVTLATVRLVAPAAASAVIVVVNGLPPMVGSDMILSVAPTIGRTRTLRPFPLSPLPPQSPSDFATTRNLGSGVPGAGAATVALGKTSTKSRPPFNSCPTGLFSVRVPVAL